MDTRKTLVARLSERHGDWDAIAKRAGLNYTTVWRIATREQVPSLDTSDRLMAAMDAESEPDAAEA